MERRFNKNVGVIPCREVPDDKYIVGATVVMKDDAGNYSTHFVTHGPEGMNAVPGEEVQDRLGGMISTAFEIANL